MQFDIVFGGAMSGLHSNNGVRVRVCLTALFLLCVASCFFQTRLVYCSTNALERTDAFSLSGVPDSPVPVSPVNGTWTEDTTPQFIWTESVGASSYALQIGNNTQFSSPALVSIEGIHESSFTLTTELTHGRWFWHVRAENASGVGGFSGVMEITIVPSRTVVTVDGTVEAIIAFVAVTSVIGVVVLVQRRCRRGAHDDRRTGKRNALTPAAVGAVMMLLGSLAPYALKYQSFTDPITHESYTVVNVVAIPWYYLADSQSVFFGLVSGPLLAFSVVLLAFYVAFVLTVVDYCKGISTGPRVFGMWFTSQIPVLTLSIPPYMTAAFPGSVFYSGPTFITLMAGYVMMRATRPRSEEEWVQVSEQSPV